MLCTRDLVNAKPKDEVHRECAISKKRLESRWRAQRASHLKERAKMEMACTLCNICLCNCFLAKAAKLMPLIQGSLGSKPSQKMRCTKSVPFPKRAEVKMACTQRASHLKKRAKMEMAQALCNILLYPCFLSKTAKRMPLIHKNIH